MELPQRKRIRLTDYDYSTPGAYFLTLCTREKQMLLWQENAVGAAISRPPNAVPIPFGLSRYGELVDRAIQNIPQHYPGITVDRYVIMPNHVHMLLRIGWRAADSRPYGETDGRQSGAALAQIVGQMKRWVSKQAGCQIWQRSFYDHVVRNESDFREIWTYIDANPSNWRKDCAELE